MSTATHAHRPGADPGAARRRAERLWEDYARTLSARDAAAFAELFTPDARFVVAYPVDGVPPVLEGRDAVRGFIGALAGAVTEVWVSDAAVHQTDDPAVALVEYRLGVDLPGGGTYRDRLVARLTFRGEHIAEVLEFYGETAHAQFLRDLGVIA